MAEEEKDDKTEQASSRRMSRAREEGNIAVSRDVAMLAALGAGAWLLTSAGAGLRDRLVSLVQASGHALATGEGTALLPLMIAPAGIVMAICMGVALAAATAFLLQTRGGMWPGLALPDFTRVFSAQRLGGMLKKDALISMGLTLVKGLTLGRALWAAFRDDFMTLPSLLGADTAVQLDFLFHPVVSGFAKILTALTFVAGLDFAVTTYRYRQKMKMTKQEAKQEYREEEGDPQIKGRRRRKHRELVKVQVAVEVPRADVLVVNPTHIAIALRYRPNEDPAPRVTAKGKGALAETMRDLARSNGIPIVQDIALARLLFRRVKVGRAVPMETFKAVAAVLAYVYKILGRNNAAANAARVQR